jgi:hypothetical protein
MNYIQRLSWAECDNIEPSVSHNAINKMFLQKPLPNKGLLRFFNLTKEEILQDNSKDIRVFDTIDTDDGYIFLVHYIYQKPHPKVETIRGTIVRFNIITDTYEIICQSFPFTPEVTVNEVEIEDNYFSRMTILPAHEGTILRVWWCADKGGRWLFSTHRKLNASNSKWGGQEFGLLFDDLFPAGERDNLLDKNYCYIFLMCHPENRLIVPYERGFLIHVASYSRKTSTVVQGYTLEDKLKHPNITYITPIKSIKNMENLKAYMEGLDWKEVGLIIYISGLEIPIKIVSSKYLGKRELRDNEPNIRIQWFKCQAKGKEKELEELFPEKEEYWATLKVDLVDVIDYLLEKYEERYRDYSPRSRILKEVHWVLESFHLELTSSATKDNKVEVMKSMFSRYNARVKNAIIREMHRERKMAERQRYLEPTESKMSSLTILME